MAAPFCPLNLKKALSGDQMLCSVKLRDHCWCKHTDNSISLPEKIYLSGLFAYFCDRPAFCNVLSYTQNYFDGFSVKQQYQLWLL